MDRRVERTGALSGPTLHVDEYGAVDGTPALFLHGFMSSNLQWELNRETLGSELRMLMAEQLGHGRSPAPDEPDAYRADAVLDRLEQVRIDHGVERWWVIGQSLGGAIVVHYALRHPERVLGVVITNSMALFGRAGRRPSGRRVVFPDEPTREDLRALPYHPANARRIPEPLRSRMAAAADAMSAAPFRHRRSGGPWDGAGALHRIEAPMLVVNGRFEKAFQPFVARMRAEAPAVRIVDLDGGHAVNLHQPEGFNQAVLDMVNDHRRP